MSLSGPSSESELEGLLIAAFDSYRRGLRRQPKSQFSMPPRGFDSLTFLGTIGWVPLEHRLQLRNLNIACSKGLFAARQGHLDEALRYYEQARGLLDCLKDNASLAWHLGVSTYQAGVAYLDFRRGCAQLASERLEWAMNADLELEQSGLPVMQMHRIQQGHNLARMDFRLGRREAAVGLAGILLAYMERRIDALPFHREWRPRSLQAVPRSLLQAMSHQIISDTASFIVAGNTPAEEWRGLIEASHLCRDPQSAVSPQVQYALRAQSDRLVNNPESYLRNLDRFFSIGIRNCHLLWYVVMVELVGFCRELGTHRSLQVRELILRDSAKWRGLPLFLRDCLDGPAAQRNVA